jgi:hypothetical protein
MIRTWKAALPAATLALLAACGGGDDDAPSTSTGGTTTAVSVVLSQDFNKDADGWSGEASDYTTETAPTGVNFGLRPTAGLNSGYTGAQAFYVGGTNRSDDLLLYVKKQYTGFVANTEYTFYVTTLNLLTSAPSGCLGVGGAPGESVYVIAAASATEPKAVNTNGTVAMNINRGNQGTAGTASLVLGNIANGLPCNGPTKWASKLVRNLTGVKVKSDGEGKLWIMLGIDSGFEAASEVYLQNMTVQFVPVTTTTT